MCRSTPRLDARLGPPKFLEPKMATVRALEGWTPEARDLTAFGVAVLGERSGRGDAKGDIERGGAMATLLRDVLTKHTWEILL